jgi:small subunit ribosomal protein S5
MKIKERINAGDYSLKERLVSLRRVTKVTKGGRNFSFSAVVVVGNGEGVVGYGLGKSNEVSEAVAKGANDAKKRLVKVSTSKDSIAHEVLGKFGGGRVLLKPASPGTGIVAGGGVRVVLESAGIQNILSKSKGSSNACNVVKATFDALSQLRDPLEIANLRGVSLDKVFNG